MYACNRDLLMFRCDLRCIFNYIGRFWLIALASVMHFTPLVLPSHGVRRGLDAADCIFQIF
jgi:hypothetical protein